MMSDRSLLSLGDYISSNRQNATHVYGGGLYEESVKSSSGGNNIARYNRLYVNTSPTANGGNIRNREIKRLLDDSDTATVYDTLRDFTTQKNVTSFRMPRSTEIDVSIIGSPDGELKYDIFNMFTELNNKINTIRSKLDEPYTREPRLANAIFGLFDPFRTYKTNAAARCNNYNINNAGLKITEIYNIYKQSNILPKKGAVNYFDNAAFPGSFIVMTHHHVLTNNPRQKFNWYASSLLDSISMNESPLEDIFGLYQNYKDHFIMDKKHNGDVTDTKNIKYARKKLSKSKNGKINLYTSDLGFDVASNYSDQEGLHMFANFGQIIYGLAILAEGGSLITKQYTFFNCANISMMYLLSSLFREFYVCKPQSSKINNLETYLVGIGLYSDRVTKVLPKLFSILDSKVVTYPMFSRDMISVEFIDALNFAANEIYGRHIKSLGDSIKIYNEVMEGTKNIRDTKMRISKATALVYKKIRRYMENEHSQWENNNPLKPIRTILRLNMKDAYRQLR